MPSNTSDANFPRFLCGNIPSLQRRLKVEAKRWATQYARDGTFPEPDTIVIPADTVVRVSSVTDFAREVPAWRLFFVRLLKGAINEALNWHDYERVSSDFEAYALRFPWGSLSAAIEHSMPNTIQSVSARLAAVLGFWELLDNLRYMDKDLQPVTLPELMKGHFGDLLEMWLPQASGNIREDLLRVLDILRRAGRGEVEKRVVTRIGKLAQVDQRITHRSPFTDAVWLKNEIAKSSPSAFENLATGYLPDLLRTLYIVDDSVQTLK